jgi:phenylpropionate dioxygenase-like ring-hydroxylating dioxygenase large terminal subunit
MQEPTLPSYAATMPRHYHDPDTFVSERDRIFARTWCFAGLANEIPEPNDYFLLEHAGLDLIVQNCGGVPRAFVNSCSHRHSRIHEEPAGRRRLICPYHGWRYDNEGRPAGIPGRNNFPQVTAQPESFALRRVELERAGHFLFVRVTPGGPPLQRHLGHVWEFLQRASVGLHHRMDHFRGELDTNWKVAIENALEGYHVPMVHNNTLAAIKQFSDKTEDITDHLPRENGHSYMVHKASGEWLARWRRYERALGTWPFPFEHYIHQLIFPNLTVTSFMGYSFHIQRFNPDAVGRTSVDSMIYSVQCDGQTEQGAGIMRAVYEEGRQFTRKVFAEDKRACELAYAGVRNASRRAVLGAACEKRIAHFQRAYLRALGDTLTA